MSAEPGAFQVRFDAVDRACLLRLPQIGPKVVDRLEAAGFDSLATMRRAGLDAVVKAVCSQVGNRAWANRRRALARALGVPD
ncbi:MAG: hypothetical protein H6933_12815 [Burkholderiaceae bacterium]|nr:hypothetical protein [Rhodoferax sp.]MCP5285771.1 hypothetical protein [Burkholderiaceae bacterium]